MNQYIVNNNCTELENSMKSMNKICFDLKTILKDIISYDLQKNSLLLDLIKNNSDKFYNSS